MTHGNFGDTEFNLPVSTEQHLTNMKGAKITEVLWSGHVDQIDVADYLSGKMKKDVRAAVVKHLAKCKTCMNALLSVDKAPH